MAVCGTIGFFIGSLIEEPIGGANLFSMISGIAFVVYSIDNKENRE